MTTPCVSDTNTPSIKTSSHLSELVCGLTRGNSSTPVIFKYKLKTVASSKRQKSLIGFSPQFFEKKFHRQTLIVDGQNENGLFKEVRMGLVPIKQRVDDQKQQLVTCYQPVLLSTPYVILTNLIKDQTKDVALDLSINQTTELSTNQITEEQPLDLTTNQ